MIEIAPGFAFLSRRLEYETKHLYIVISIIEDNTKALFVNVTTKKGKDTSCILKPGDHEFVKYDSEINYGDATISEIDNLREAINTGVFTLQKPVSNDLLKRILEGAVNSDALPQKFLKYIPTIS